MRLWMPVALFISFFLMSATQAQAQFEVKGLDVEKGGVEIDYQADYAFGHPSRKVEDEGGGEFVFDENEINRQRHSLELGLGLTDYLQISVGVEFEQERFDEPISIAEANAFDSLKASAVQIEGTLVLIPLKGNGFGLGVNGQLEPSVIAGEASSYIISPILAAVSGPWSVTLNPGFRKSYGGEEDPDEGEFRDEKWSFEYAWQAAYKHNDAWTFALEGYGDIGRIGGSGTRSEASLEFGDADHHRIGPVVYYSFSRASHAPKSVKDDDDDAKAGDDDDDDDEGTEITMSFGTLFGLNDETSDVTLKWGMEVEF
jgi:hypothetical protein